MILSNKYQPNNVVENWTLIKQVNKPIENKTNGVYWLCKCKCGKEKIIFEQSLSQGKSKSCGCVRQRDLIGQHFGKLVVIERQNKIRQGYKESAWLCKCDCGKTCVVSENHLLTKKNPTQSCGCLRIERVKKVSKKYNTYDLSGKYGVGYTTKGEKFYFNLEDYDKIKDYCWYINAGGYVVCGNQRLNRFVLNCIDSNYVVDHKNRNPLDNRKTNLRVCFQRSNTQNTSMRSSNTSGFTGVWKDKRKNNRWVAEIMCYGKKRFLGYFDTCFEAAKTRFEASIMYFQEFSSYYNAEINIFETIFFDKEGNKVYKFTYKKPTELPETDVEELTYDELKAIPSKRGNKCLGSSGK